jgi:hypothetical protein
MWQRRAKAGTTPAGLVFELAGGMPELVRGALQAVEVSDGLDDPGSVLIGHSFAGSVADPVEVATSTAWTTRPERRTISPPHIATVSRNSAWPSDPTYRLVSRSTYSIRSMSCAAR